METTWTEKRPRRAQWKPSTRGPIYEKKRAVIYLIISSFLSEISHFFWFYCPIYFPAEVVLKVISVSNRLKNIVQHLFWQFCVRDTSEVSYDEAKPYSSVSSPVSLPLIGHFYILAMKHESGVPYGKQTSSRVIGGIYRGGPLGAEDDLPSSRLSGVSLRRSPLSLFSRIARGKYQPLFIDCRTITTSSI